MKLFRELLPKNLLRFGISKRADHEYIVYRKAVNFKGKTAYGWKSCRLLSPATPAAAARRRMRTKARVAARRRACRRGGRRPVLGCGSRNTKGRTSRDR